MESPINFFLTVAAVVVGVILFASTIIEYYRNKKK